MRMLRGFLQGNVTNAQILQVFLPESWHFRHFLAISSISVARSDWIFQKVPTRRNLPSFDVFRLFLVQKLSPK